MFSILYFTYESPIYKALVDFDTGREVEDNGKFKTIKGLGYINKNTNNNVLRKPKFINPETPVGYYLKPKEVVSKYTRFSIRVFSKTYKKYNHKYKIVEW